MKRSASLPRGLPAGLDATALATLFAAATTPAEMPSLGQAMFEAARLQRSRSPADAFRVIIQQVDATGDGNPSQANRPRGLG